FIGGRADVDAAKKEIMSKWNSKDLGPARLFVGFQIERDRAAKSLKIHQSLYASKILERFGMANANPRKIPMTAGMTLAEDLSWSVGQLARFMTSPSEEHLRVAKEVLRYLKGTISTGILYIG